MIYSVGIGEYFVFVYLNKEPSFRTRNKADLKEIGIRINFGNLEQRGKNVVLN